MAFDLVLAWAGLLAFAVFAYVVMDGFDLGIGILFPWLKPGAQRDTAINSVAPVWDGNETWLVLGGGGLMAAFPLAYAIVMPAVYAPLIAMLLALVFRGVAFEFRWRDPGHRRFWDVAFAAGSVIAALTQGVILGAILQGVSVEGRRYAGGWWDWLSPFSLLAGASLAAGYATLGAGWLIIKTEGDLQALAYRLAARCGAALVIGIVLVSLATPFLEEDYRARWFDMPGVLLTAQVPLLVTLTTALFFRSLARQRVYQPFLLTLGLFALSFLGLGVSLYPDVLPGRLTLWEAASPASSLGFMIIGAAVLIPVILAYTAHAYWAFRGKVSHHGYH
jgi:cytochrome bd ubiquinol oxidase subunit II